uniref:RING-type E3 ubiquitin transferase n=2 Tax=Mesocestoides corti TaxID=53468 RepID=A0A5K3FTS5_MESCO
MATPTANEAMTPRHEGVKCDACNANAFQLRRYKCLRCIDFDLCGYCYDNQRETNSHKKTHPTQCLILEGDYNIFYPNRKSDTTTRSYTCPVCGAMGFQVAELGAHVFDQHGSSRVGVICPICVAPLPDDSSGGGGNSNKLHNSFSHHLMDAHHIKRSPTSIEPPDVTMRKSVYSFGGASTGNVSEPCRQKDPVLNPTCYIRSAAKSELFELLSRSTSTETLRRSWKLRLRPLNSQASQPPLIPPITPLQPRKEGAAVSENHSDAKSGEENDSRFISSSTLADEQTSYAPESTRQAGGDTVASQQIAPGNNSNTIKHELVQEDEQCILSPGSPSLSALSPPTVVPSSTPFTSISIPSASQVNTVTAVRRTVSTDKPKDTFDTMWSVFLQELIWDSLHIANLQLQTRRK